jgi:hypothetical protein
MAVAREDSPRLALFLGREPGAFGNPASTEIVQQV